MFTRAGNRSGGRRSKRAVRSPDRRYERRRRRSANGERASTDTGQAAVLVLTVTAVLLVVIVLAVAAMGRTSIDRTRAQTAADAAALASLEGGRAAATIYAERHGAEVVEWFIGPEPFEVTVVVRLGDTTATARASNAP